MEEKRITCRICGKSIREHGWAALEICAKKNQFIEEKENKERRKKGHEPDSHDGGVFTFDC